MRIKNKLLFYVISPILLVVFLTLLVSMYVTQGYTSRLLKDNEQIVAGLHMESSLLKATDEIMNYLETANIEHYEGYTVAIDGYERAVERYIKSTSTVEEQAEVETLRVQIGAYTTLANGMVTLVSEEVMLKSAIDSNRGAIIKSLLLSRLTDKEGTIIQSEVDELKAGLEVIDRIQGVISDVKSRAGLGSLIDAGSDSEVFSSARFQIDKIISSSRNVSNVELFERLSSYMIDVGAQASSRSL